MLNTIKIAYDIIGTGDNMSYQSLYRRYRPTKIQDVVAQQHIMEVLIKSIKKDKISHAYLFCGPRGTGKTSIAKLFAKAVNCTSNDTVACGVCENCLASQEGNHPDIVEIDAASNNGVDEIRSLIERVKYTPISGKHKIYIIDEVHMLSQGAFNALLKTLEEPPKHVIFVLATTEIHKVLPTIISRCQRFDFTRIPNDAIKGRLDYILENEGVSAEEGVTSTIASLSGGGLRNALTILEQAIVLADEKITVKQIYDNNGMITPSDKVTLFNNIIDGELDTLMSTIKVMQSQSVQFERLIMDFVSNIKDSVILTHTNQTNLIDLNNLKIIEFLEKNFDVTLRLKMIEILLSYVEKMRFTQMPEMYFDVAMMEIYSTIHSLKDNRVEDLRVVTQQEKKVKPKKDINNLVKAESIINHVVEEVKENPHDERSTDQYNPSLNLQLDIPVDSEDNISSRNQEITEIEDSRVSNSLLDQKVNEETLVQLMVSASKEYRQVDSQKFETKLKYRNNPTWARPARLLDDFSLVLSGEFFVVVASSNDLSLKELLENRNREALYAFSKEIFKEDKLIIPTSNHEFKQAVEMFVKRQREGNLPQGITKDQFYDMKPVLAQGNIDESLDKILSLFGDEIEIME